MVFLVSDKRRGFLLAEIVVIAAIVAILSSIVTVNVMESHKKSNDIKRIADIETLRVAFRVYRDGDGTYPSGVPFDAGITIDSGDFDAGPGGLLQYVTGHIEDPLWNGNLGSAYQYVYDSSFDCSVSGSGKKVLYAKTMERSISSNWATICGTFPAGGTNTYGIILQ